MHPQSTAPRSPLAEVFISYSRKNGLAICQQLIEVLGHFGIASWYDGNACQSHPDHWPPEIAKRLRHCGCAILLCTETSEDNTELRASAWQCFEAGAVYGQSKAVIPVTLSSEPLSNPLLLLGKRFNVDVIRRENARALSPLVRELLRHVYSQRVRDALTVINTLVRCALRMHDHHPVVNGKAKPEKNIAGETLKQQDQYFHRLIKGPHNPFVDENSAKVMVDLWLGKVKEEYSVTDSFKSLLKEAVDTAALAGASYSDMVREYALAE